MHWDCHSEKNMAPPKLECFIYNTFSDRTFCGNRAAVILNADALFDDEVLKQIAGTLGCDTAFVFGFYNRDLSIRFMTQSHEMTMCGHALIGALCCIVEHGAVKVIHGETTSLNLKGVKGIVSADITLNSKNQLICKINLPRPWFKPVQYNLNHLEGILGIDLGSIRTDQPQIMGGTGLSHLFVPVNERKNLEQASPNYESLATFSREMGVESIALFFSHSLVDIRMRDFCPAIGVHEESASGTTVGALCSYLNAYVKLGGTDGGVLNFRVEQGPDLNRSTVIACSLSLVGSIVDQVCVEGTAKLFLSGTMDLFSEH